MSISAERKQELIKEYGATKSGDTDHQRSRSRS